MSNLTIEDRVERLEDVASRVAETMHNYGVFHAPDHRTPHEVFEQIRLELGDDDFAAHLGERQKQWAERAEEENAAKSNAVKQQLEIDALKKQLEELKADSKTSAEADQLRAIVASQAEQLKEMQAMLKQILVAQNPIKPS